MKSTTVLQVDFLLNECLKVMVSSGQNFLLRLCWILETLRKVSVKLKMLAMVMFDRRRYKNLRWSVFHSQSYCWNTYTSFLRYCCRRDHAIASARCDFLSMTSFIAASAMLWINSLFTWHVCVSLDCSWAGGTHLSTALHLTDMLSSS